MFVVLTPRIELGSPGYQPDALPLSYTRIDEYSTCKICLATVDSGPGKTAFLANPVLAEHVGFLPAHRVRVFQRAVFRVHAIPFLVGIAGFEPATFRPPAGRATRLRYTPMIRKRSVRAAGFEPATPCSQSRCATRLRYARTEHSQIVLETTTGVEPV